MGCSGPFGSARPSMVSTSAPSICHTKTVQDFTAFPSTCTTQAPHCEVSHPTWVPVRRRSSRRNCTSRVRGSMSPVTALPFTVIATAAMVFLLDIRPNDLLCAGCQMVPTAKGAEINSILLRERLVNKPTFAVCGTAGQGHCRRRPAAPSRCSARIARHREGEFLEEIVSRLLGGGVDQALP